MVLGYLLITLSTFGFAIISYIHEKAPFLIVALINIFIQGLSDYLVSTSIYNIINIEFPS